MNIVIVGLGVVGGSFAMALKDAGYTDVYGIDVNEETLKKAKERELIKEGSRTGKELLKNADLTIISIYPKLVKNFVEDNKDYFKKGSIITDATGIKGMFINDIIKILPSDIDFVFGHPMAGREKKGIDFASSEVFKGANYIITPISRNKEENIKKIEDLAKSIGFKRVKRITPEFHDEMIGYTSQLPHAIAVALINSDEEGRETGSFIGDSYRDLTRIANINEDLWSELFLGNKDNLLKAITNFELELDFIKKAMYSNDKEALKKLFVKSTKRREKLD
ncbi:prephenate dehydrogenase [Clostridium sp. HCP1S3_B4]|uniref:prephenate dehydrogenase n=1 Tax=unclassified Clostridium TaxID=2614128 RepID=UPI002A79F9F8|nr:prephenate dehydrogenase [Clostridiales bacterium]MDY2730154.1 prephenate dehydrogenase [Clostridium sp.]